MQEYYFGLISIYDLTFSEQMLLFIAMLLLFLFLFNIFWKERN